MLKVLIVVRMKMGLYLWSSQMCGDSQPNNSFNQSGMSLSFIRKIECFS